MNAEHFLTTDNFFESGNQLREHYDKQFSNVREAHENRFVWDYWHIEDQYTLIRTPAYHYFPDDLYQQFQQHLVEWGRRTLGCYSISPPWLSYYIDGCQQALHADSPHGPWAFIYSLTQWKERRFRGGETMIVKPPILSYWQGFQSDVGKELHDIVDLIEPEFNRLTVFDPRLPHGVKRVEGVRDPCEARLVIHGWFTEPRPYVEGEVDEADVGECLQYLTEALGGAMQSWPLMEGYLSVRIDVNEKGQTSSLRKLTDTVVNTERVEFDRDQVWGDIQKTFAGQQFPVGEGPYQITLPLIFKS